MASSRTSGSSSTTTTTGDSGTAISRDNPLRSIRAIDVDQGRFLMVTAAMPARSAQQRGICHDANTKVRYSVRCVN
jgi:hypothetical protein